MSKKEEEPKPPLKLYILTRRNMTPEQQAVQAGHAVAMFCQESPHKKKWTNGTLIYLSVVDHQSFYLWSDIVDKMSKAGKYWFDWGIYYDRELHGDEATAMYIVGQNAHHYVRDLSLMRFT